MEPAQEGPGHAAGPGQSLWPGKTLQEGGLGEAELLINYVFSYKIISGYVLQVPPSQEVQRSPRGLAGARVAAWGAQGDSPWHGAGRGHRSGRGDPRPVPTPGCDHQPSPTPPHTPAEPFPSPLPCLAPTHLLQPWERKRRHGRGRGGTSWSRAGAWEVTGEAAFLQWSWKTHLRGHI